MFQDDTHYNLTLGLTENSGHEIAGKEIARHGKYRDRE